MKPKPPYKKAPKAIAEAIAMSEILNPTEKIPNNGNWFLAEIIERCENVDANKKTVNRRCTVWGNMHLIKAATPEKAYEKAEKIGKSANYRFTNTDGIQMKWEFLGIGDIIPIYEDIEDGAEILWTNYGKVSAKRSKGFAKTKKELLKKF